jgi:hypothetical protein
MPERLRDWFPAEGGAADALGWQGCRWPCLERIADRAMFDAHTPRFARRGVPVSPPHSGEPSLSAPATASSPHRSRKEGRIVTGVQTSNDEPFRTTRPTDPEHMDAPDVPPDELSRSFRFIRRVNRWLGGAAACLRVLKREATAWQRGESIRWIDLGTGVADIPLAVDRWATRNGYAVTCVAVDNHAACLRLARDAVGSHPRIRVAEGNALDPHFGVRPADPEDRAGKSVNGPPTSNAHMQDGSPAIDPPFDYAHAGMFLHHLRDAEVVQVLRTMGRLARRRVIWNDLLRAPWSETAVRIATLGQPEIVRYDALLSVRKGFTPSEARAAAEAAGLREIVVHTSPLVGRFVLTARGLA